MASRSSDRPEIICGVAGECREVVAQPGIGLRTSQAGQKLCFGQPTPTLRLCRAEHRDGRPLTVIVMSSPAWTRRSTPAVSLRRSRDPTSVMLPMYYICSIRVLPRPLGQHATNSPARGFLLAGAVDGDLEGSANLTHPGIGKPTKAADQDCH